MLNPKEIRKKGERKYADYLRSLVLKEPFFPFEIKGSKGRTTMPIEQLFPALQNLLSQSKQQKDYGYEVELKSVQSRKMGTITMPKRVYFSNEQDYLQFLGKIDEVKQFRIQLQRTHQILPALLDFIVQSPLKLIKNLGIWEDVLKVANYFLANPMPKCYLRELPIEIHTKFIEENKGIISEILDSLLPESDYFPAEKKFTKRYGLRYDEALIRLRTLDEKLTGFPGFIRDIALPVQQFQRLDLRVNTVFVIENKQTFLAFPKRQNSVAIWGKGFAVELLKRVGWLTEKQIYFWGDLDVQGFQMLHQLRTYFPQTKSLLMDIGTYESFHQYAIKSKPTVVEDLHTLTFEEHLLFEQLRKNIDKGRLEQEHISQAYLLKYFAKTS